MTNKEKKQIIIKLFDTNHIFVAALYASNEDRYDPDFAEDYNMLVISYNPSDDDMYDAIPLFFIQNANKYDSNRDIVLDYYDDVYDALVLHGILQNEEDDI